jgi:ribosomal protein S18 acetylase RimI-like enzyme
MLSIGPYRDDHFVGVKTLWEQVFPSDPPWNRAEAAIPPKLAHQPELFLVAADGDSVVGTVMAGYDGHRGWIYALAVAPEYRRLGIASLLLTEAESRLQALGCAKINLQVRASNDAVAAFYERHGYAVEQRLSMGKRVDPA